jgi:hypothetical protein
MPRSYARSSQGVGLPDRGSGHLPQALGCMVQLLSNSYRIFLLCIFIAALSTVGMPYIEGYGTVLAQVVGLGAWALVAAASSGIFADQHHQFIWPIAASLNVILYSVVATPVYFLLRRRAPKVLLVFLLLWLTFYVACLYVLFPATDGP